MFDLSYYHGILTSTAELFKEELSVEDEKTLFEYYHMLVEKPIECFPIEIDNYENELELEAYEAAISIARFLKDSTILVRLFSFTSIFGSWIVSNYNHRWLGFTQYDVDLIIMELKKILPLMDIDIRFDYEFDDILFNKNQFKKFDNVKEITGYDEIELIKFRNAAKEKGIENIRLISVYLILGMIDSYIKNNAKMIEIICDDYHDANVFYFHHEKDGYYRFNQNYFEEVKNKMAFWSRLYMEYANPDIYGEDDDLPEIYEEEGDAND